MATFPPDPIEELPLPLPEEEGIPVSSEEQEVEDKHTEEEEEKCLWGLVNNFEKQDQADREYWLRKIKENILFWDGKQRNYWSYVAGDWRPIPDLTNFDGNAPGAFDRYYEDNDRIVNIYKAHGETIIASAAGSVPTVNFTPEDANDPQDIEAANTYSKIADKIQLENEAELLCVKGFAILWKQGLLFGYTYYDENEVYGTKKTPVLSMRKQVTSKESCAGCGGDLTDLYQTQGMGTPEESCPTCGNSIYDSITEYTEEEIPFVERFEDSPKGCQRIEFYGTLNVKLAPYVLDPNDSPYIILETDQHWSRMASMFPEIADKMGTTPEDTYERYIRHDDTNNSLVTVRQVWFQPWAFNELGLESEELPYYKEKYPKGCYCIFVNDKLAFVAPEESRKHWICTLSPTEDKIQAMPLGESELPIQKMTNDLVDLNMESILHNIPETYVDSEAIDFEYYNQLEAVPGMKLPVERQGNLGISSLFYNPPTASLSQEHDRFMSRVEGWGQFVVGSNPALYGGENPNKTATEYAQSRNQALQRLSIYWKMYKAFWAKLNKLAVEDYIDYLSEDESYTKDLGGGNFITVWIKRAELVGKVGQCIPEASEQFPLSWIQKRGLLFELAPLLASMPNLAAAVGSPENISEIGRTLGWKELKMPGRADQEKQLAEVQQLIVSVPIDAGMDPMTQQPIRETSVPIDVDVDNHQVHIDTLKAFLVSPAGQFLKNSNPESYENCLLHLQQHNIIVQQQAQQQAMMQASNGNPGEMN